MQNRRLLSLVLMGVLAVGTGLGRPAWASDTIADAYAAILRGDYDAGKSLLDQVLKQSGASEAARRTRDWLSSYEKVRKSRSELRDETYAWDVKHSKEALENGKVYLALTFAAQAALYTQDKDGFAKQDWVKTLRTRGLDEARRFVDEGKWRKAHRVYAILQRLDEHDHEVKQLREQAARHARLAVLYKDDESVERRIKGVNFDLLQNATRLIGEDYYKAPDFRSMAKGALDNLIALCGTKSLYDGPDASRVFDGVGNAASREHFIGRLHEMQRRVTTQKKFEAADLVRLFRTIRGINNESVSLPEPLLIVEFMEGALDKLDDFTSIVWPADSEDFDKMMIGEFRGVGIQLGIDELTERLQVVTPLENSPALRAGIQPNDLIIAVDGESTADWTTDKAVREITGKEGTEVVLTIFRPSTGEQIDFPLTRSRIQLTTIRGVRRIGENGDKWDYMLDAASGIAYVQLTGFNPESYDELVKALSAAESQGMKGLVLDLRGNPGGLLDIAVEIVSLFVPRGEVVSTVGRVEKKQELNVRGGAKYADLPLVVLVNGSSASASEIVSGALQDHHRAVVLGSRTFGKGSVQRVMALQRRLGIPRRTWSGARLKLTTALYYLPSGRSPHKESPDATKWGIDPDYEVDLTPKEVSKVLERELDAFVIHNETKPAKKLDDEAIQKKLAELKAEVDDSADDSEGTLLSEEDIALIQSDPYEAADVDPQLEKALLHMRIKLAANLPWPTQIAARTDHP